MQQLNNKVKGSRLSNWQAEFNNDFVIIYSKYGAISNDKHLLSKDSSVRRKC